MGLVTGTFPSQRKVKVLPLSQPWEIALPLKKEARVEPAVARVSAGKTTNGQNLLFEDRLGVILSSQNG